MSILTGVVLEAAILLAIIWVFWAELSQESSGSGQYTLPVHRQQQHQPVHQSPPRPPPPPSQSYRPSAYTPLLHQPEQHRPVYQPPPRPPPPSQSPRSSIYTPPVHQPEQPQPVSQPPPHRPPPSQSYRPSPYTPLLHQPEQHRPTYQPPPRPPPPPQSPRSSLYTPPVPQLPPRPPPPSQSYQSSPYTPPIHQPEQHQPVSQPPPHQPPPSQSYQSLPYTPPVHQPEQHQPVSQPPPRSPPPSQSHRSSPYTPPSHGPPKHEDINQQDQPNEYYIGLRARANEEKDEMARCKSESQEAYNRRDHAAAKDLSKQGKNHKQKMEQLNKEASTWIYLEKNRHSKPGEIDLHGLYVKEAITYTDAALEEAKLRGDSEIRLIVGKGLHCEGGEAKLGPAIKGLMRKYQLPAEFNPSNSGVLVVGLNGDAPIRHRQHLNISHRRSRRHRRRAGNIGA